MNNCAARTDLVIRDRRVRQRHITIVQQRHRVRQRVANRDRRGLIFISIARQSLAQGGFCIRRQGDRIRSSLAPSVSLST